MSHKNYSQVPHYDGFENGYITQERYENTYITHICLISPQPGTYSFMIPSPATSDYNHSTSTIDTFRSSPVARHYSFLDLVLNNSSETDSTSSQNILTAANDSFDHQQGEIFSTTPISSNIVHPFNDHVVIEKEGLVHRLSLDAPLLRGRRNGFSQEDINTLRTWLINNFFSPYADHDSLQALQHETSLKEVQIKNWIVNARRRYWLLLLDIADRLWGRDFVDSRLRIKDPLWHTVTVRRLGCN
ncbi:MAG: hypothetical protein EXX96DRAFT_642126 [Benjaminiella poitrasii]|nr:MAG: hypothetical protein EXX96DRAFT_642126 [Benjaminiella poitrasii]